MVPRLHILPALALALALAPAASPAAVVVLDFEESPVPDSGTQIGINEYAEDGFYIKPLGPVDADPPFRLRRNGGSTPGSPENGSPFLQLATGDSFEMTLVSGTAFVPLSVDIAEFSDVFSGIGIEVTFEGYFSDSSSVSTTFTTDGVIDGTGPDSDFETFFFPANFAGIVRVEIAELPSPIYSLSLDRFEANNVPEPSRLLLLALAPAVATLARRRPPR